MGIVQGLLMLLLALTQFGTLSEKDLESALSNPETPSKQLRLRGRTSDFHFQCFSLKHYFKRWITPSRMQRLQNHSVALKRTKKHIIMIQELLRENGYSMAPKNSRMLLVSEGNDCVYTNQ